MPINELEKMLGKTINNMVSEQNKLSTESLKDVRKNIEEFVGSIPPPPPPPDICDMVGDFFSGKLDDDGYDFISAAIHKYCPQNTEMRVIDSPNFPLVIEKYITKIKENDLWDATWYWLLTSFLSIEPKSYTKQTTQNISILKDFLANTLFYFSDNYFIPLPWAKIIKNNKNLLSDDPCSRYVQSIIDGDFSEVNLLKDQLGIPDNSWFWRELALSIAKFSAEKNDNVFKKKIVSIIKYLEKNPAFKDDVIKIILERYYECKDRSPHNELRDYVISSKVWKHPDFRNRDILSKWCSVNENAWRMVFSWVNHECLRIFFQELAKLHQADEGRFEFWEKYINQTTYTKIILGENTYGKNILKKDKCFISRLDSSYKDLDAFIMQINGYTIVEFSKTSNAAFIYKNNELPFNIDSQKLSDKTYGDGLKAARDRKRKNKNDLILIHNPSVPPYPGWYEKAYANLIKIGIYPDFGKEILGLFKA